jgi:ribonuclease HI
MLHINTNVECPFTDLQEISRLIEETKDKEDNIYIFTDGSCISMRSKYPKAGYGVFFGDNDPRNISKSIEGEKITNNVAELTAILEGILTLFSTQKVTRNKVVIVSDSEYVIKSITEYAKNWELNDWKKSDGKEVQNLDLIKQIYYLTKNLKIKYKHVRSHQKEPKDKEERFFWHGNNEADRLATSASALKR